MSWHGRRVLTFAILQMHFPILSTRKKSLICTYLFVCVYLFFYLFICLLYDWSYIYSLIYLCVCVSLCVYLCIITVYIILKWQSWDVSSHLQKLQVSQPYEETQFKTSENMLGEISDTVAFFSPSPGGEELHRGPHLKNWCGQNLRDTW